MIKSDTSWNRIVIDIKIDASYPKLLKILNDYSFIFISNINDIRQNQTIFEKLTESNIVLIGYFVEKNQNDYFFIFSFRNNLLFIKQCFIKTLKDFFSINSNMSIFFLPETQNIFNQIFEIHNFQKETDDLFLLEIKNFNEKFEIKHNFASSNEEINNLIKSCISGYLIGESYVKLVNNQYENNQYENEPPKEKLNMNDFIILRQIYCGEEFIINLIYEIDTGNLFASKQSKNKDISSLIEKEYQNYLQLNGPFFPKLYGKIDEYCFIIQFIDGFTLEDIKNFLLSDNRKIIIIFEIMLIIKYLHDNAFVYRDLKPSNIMIDDDSAIFLIDFDLMKSISNISLNDPQTKDFATVFAAPEIGSGLLSYKNDIYSLGQMMYYIMNEKYPDEPKKDNCIENIYIQQFYKRCTNIDVELRPDIDELLFEFYIVFSEQIKSSIVGDFSEVLFFDAIFAGNDDLYKLKIDIIIQFLSLAANQNFQAAQYMLGAIFYDGIYVEKDINKAIHYFALSVNQNNPIANYYLGLINYEGIYVEKDINKAIHYFTHAANQNEIDSQCNLGTIYIEGKYIQRDVDKAIHYFTLAADQNCSEAQYNLGCIYSEGMYIEKDINKAIHYYTQAAYQNNQESQYKLGLIYYNEKEIKRDINKAMYYFTLSANQNCSQAQFTLGLIFYEGKYIKRDINQSIHYFSKSAKLNCPEAQYNLGIIYSAGKYIEKDIDKAIFFLTQAANQNYLLTLMDLAFHYFDEGDINKGIDYFNKAANLNCSEAQYNLGNIYYFEIGIKRDINKSIYYYTQAANQNNTYAQLNIGVIFYEGKYIERDVNKAIDYFTQAANLNCPDAQNNLGMIFYEGKYIE